MTEANITQKTQEN